MASSHDTVSPPPTPPPPDASLPSELEPRQLARRAVGVVALLAALALVVILAPGLGEVRAILGDAEPAWLVAAVALELLSCLSYVLMFRPIFCRRMTWRTASRIGWSELGVGSIVPASGAAGLALGAWALIQGGLSVDRVARRSVAFFLIKSSVNFVAVAVLGSLMAIGLLGPSQSLWLTALPAAMATLLIVAILLLPLIGEGEAASADAGRLARWTAVARRSIVRGTREASELVRSGDPRILAGAVGYWAWDNMVLWATFHAFGASVPITIVLMGYLIGQLGGLLPIPGGVGGIDGGLIGTLIVFGAPAAATAAAVLAYRVILFWLPLIGGSIGFVSLRRQLRREPDGVFARC